MLSALFIHSPVTIADGSPTTTVLEEALPGYGLLTPSARVFNTSDYAITAVLTFILDLGDGEDPLYNGSYSEELFNASVPANSSVELPLMGSSLIKTVDTPSATHQLELSYDKPANDDPDSVAVKILLFGSQDAGLRSPALVYTPGV